MNYNEQWSFQFDKRHSLLDEENIETTYSIKYQPQCWSIKLEYNDQPDDKSIAVLFTLLGLGDVGGYSYSTYSADSEDTTSVEAASERRR